MALDPRQSPSEVYAGVPAGVVARGESGKADIDLGQIRLVELSGVHRFTPEILRLIQHIHRLYPALDLGSDWQVDIDALQSTVSHGAKPKVFVHANQLEEIAAVDRRIETLLAATTSSERIAVVILDPLQLEVFGERLGRKTQRRVSVIRSRDDVDTTLRYSRRSVILGASEYLAGLQFDNVLIAGFPGAAANEGDYQRRRTLTLLYLAASRATRHVELHVNVKDGGLPKILEGAIEAEIVEQQSLG